MTDPQPYAQIHRAIKNVQAAVAAVDRDQAEVQMKSGGKFNYRYASEPTLMDFLRPLLVEQGVATYVDVQAIAIQGNTAHVRAVVKFVHEDGSQAHAAADGFATDTGDKHLAKAQTSAVRQCLQKTFLVPNTDPQADPDRSGEEVPPVSQPQVDVEAAAKALTDLTELAERKGLANYLTSQLSKHQQQSGLDVPPVDYLRELWKAINAAPNAVGAPPAPTPTPDPAPAPAAAQATYHTADQREQMNGLLEDLAKLKADEDWQARLESGSQQTFGKPWVFTTPQEAAGLIERMTATLLQLRQDAPPAGI